ncbi:MAG: helix-turn-helix domain-containing protein [Dissulfurispiraceae bacterium]
MKEKLQNPKFKENYEHFKVLTDIAVKIAIEREKLKLSQAALAQKAGITQQQLSRIENAHDYQLSTLSKVLNALGISFEFTKAKKSDTTHCSPAISLKCGCKKKQFNPPP